MVATIINDPDVKPIQGANSLNLSIGTHFPPTGGAGGGAGGLSIVTAAETVQVLSVSSVSAIASVGSTTAVMKYVPGGTPDVIQSHVRGCWMPEARVTPVHVYRKVLSYFKSTSKVSVVAPVFSTVTVTWTVSPCMTVDGEADWPTAFRLR